MFFALLQQYRDYCGCSAVLFPILSSFDPAFVSQHALDMTAIMKASAEVSGTPRSKLYLALGKALIQHTPPQPQRLPILNDVWKVVTKIEQPTAYVEIAAVFVQYLLLNFTEREVRSRWASDSCCMSRWSGCHDDNAECSRVLCSFAVRVCR